ncbi:MAG: TAXI family TRAP transporter solute-binding subunit [Rhodospirillaceae bacterium]|mgnify:CR=1 FL=1|nr:TAXI family TRAP transporter solute-binding subunit [Rhodospirillaceae bacterium]MBT5038960.1 TAXI family TRAP transporter solute-binding subunit [Rhodospirillaceae bacterium]MBT5674380.1 TAXI family TRAP transporter solute-binding subunit [Rhodospirillaceae bacterium]MBT7294481.1 TAXI family TRAP transporter solute-binding subunit [Rhodospirillaceae bacterium]
MTDKFKFPRRTFLRYSAAAAAAGMATAVAGTLTAPLGAKTQHSYLLGTGTTGGTYYPVGVAIATLVKVKLEPKAGIAMSAITSAGSGENLKLLRENQVQFAILQGLWGAHAKAGTGPFAEAGPQAHLRGISMLWPNVEHFIVRSEYAASGTVADLAALAGKGFSIGKRNSGTEGSNRHILAGLGLDPEAMFDLAFLGYGPSADALINGKIAGMSTPAGPPVSAVTRAFAALGEDITILSFTPGEIARANAGFDLWTPYTLAAGTYPGQETGVGTIAQPNFLGVRADVDDEAVYQITKSMHENLPFLNNIHKATRAISLESALSGLPVPLHPGAARYYQEQGLDIPGALLGG